MNTRTTLSALFALFLLAAAPAQAQTDISIGPRVSYDIGGDLEAFAIGADARIGVATLPVRINPSFDYYASTDLGANVDAAAFQISVNALYELGIENTTFTPYAGGGLSYLQVSPDADGVDDESAIGLNILGGAEFTEIGGFVPFAQAQFTLGGQPEFGGGGSFEIDPPFAITGGILFNI